MPILRLEPDFPAKSVLESEDIFAIDSTCGATGYSTAKTIDFKFDAE